MIEHVCIYCNLKTNQKCDYDKHLLTKKHKNNMINHKIKLENTDIYNYCEYCNFKSKQRSDYNKHIITKKHKYNLEKFSENNKTQTKDISNNLIHTVIKQNEELRKEIKELKQVSNENTNKIVKEARTIKKSLLSILNTEFKDTPSIEYINENEFREEFEEEYNLKLDDTDNRLFMRIFSDFKKRKLIQSMCNVIVRIIKKEDQKQQSVFNIDASRGNYATKIQDIWHNDKKGLQLKKYTIDVVTKYMLNIMDIYRARLVEMYNENKIKKNINVTDYIMEYQGLLFDINSFLTNPNTHKRIILQLCPELRFEEKYLE